MAGIKKILLVIGIGMMAALTGCSGSKDEPVGQAVGNIETYSNDDMEVWVGEYGFTEVVSGDIMMFMIYDINVYKENDAYYADVEINGQMTGINLKARLYGNAEWASLVIVEYYPEHVTGISEMEDNVILSLRRQGDKIYTYWGLMTPLLENENMMSGNVYLEREDESEISTETTEASGLDDWIGEYAFSEKDGANQMDYHIDIHEENSEYYADIVISGPDLGIDVKAQIYGDEEWISLVLMDYNSGHVNGWEDLENSVLFSLRRQGDKIYTYWGEHRVTYPLLMRYISYWESNEYFMKVEKSEGDRLD